METGNQLTEARVAQMIEEANQRLEMRIDLKLDAIMRAIAAASFKPYPDNFNGRGVPIFTELQEPEYTTPNKDVEESTSKRVEQQVNTAMFTKLGGKYRAKSKDRRQEKKYRKDTDDDLSASSPNDSDDSDESEDNEAIDRDLDRRKSILRRVGGFEESATQVVTRMKPVASSDHIKLSYLNVRQAITFGREIDRYQTKEDVPLKATVLVSENLIPLILAKNASIGGHSQFYRLSNVELLKAIQRSIRPEDPQEFLKALERNVKLDWDEKPSWPKFKTFSDKLYIFKDEFIETVCYLLKGCAFRKEIQYNIKDGSPIKIFLDAISGNYGWKLIRGGRRNFDSLVDFLSYFFKLHRELYKLSKRTSTVVSLYFLDNNTAENPAQKLNSGKTPFKSYKLNNLSLEGDQERVEEDDGDTDYYDIEPEDADLVPMPDDAEEIQEHTLNAISQPVKDKPGSVTLLKRPSNFSSSKPVQPGICYQFALEGNCSRKNTPKGCSYLHPDSSGLATFLQQTKNKVETRMSLLKSEK
ncbi:MAG: hypothetical protein RL059_338 [Bacteroidota bacterium]